MLECFESAADDRYLLQKMRLTYLPSFASEGKEFLLESYMKDESIYV